MQSEVERAWERAQRRLARLSAKDAAAEMSRGAMLVDTRSERQRATDGDIPGALLIERSVLEWRLDPTSPWRIPEAVDRDVRVVLICAGGFSSVFAAVSLLDLGMQNVTDVIGGFDAWKAAGLPIVTDREDGEPR